MKKVIALVVLTALIVCNTVGAFAATDIFINSEVFSFSQAQPIIKNKRVLVPLQSGIFEKFSVTTEYDHINKEIIIRTRTHLLTMYMNELVIYDKGIKCYDLDVRPEYIDGQIYVPLRGFIESMGMSVEYVPETHTVKIR